MTEVRFRDPQTQEGYVAYPTFILRDPRTSCGARVLYGLLQSYAWQQSNCRPGQKALASAMGVGERQVRTYLKELVDVGLVEVDRRGLTQTNVYWLTNRFLSDRKDPSGQERTHASDEVEEVEVEVGGKPPTTPGARSADGDTRERGEGARHRRQAKKKLPAHNPALTRKLIGE